VLTKGSVLIEFHSFSAPRRASVCSTSSEPRSLTTSAALYAFPARVLRPVFFQGGDLLLAGQVGPVAHDSLRLMENVSGLAAPLQRRPDASTVSLVEDIAASYVL
jgi:hypothetical protein